MSHLRKMGDKKWKIIIDLGKDENGNRQRKYKTVNVAQPEAKRIMSRMEAELLDKPDLNGEIKLKEHLREWLEYYSSNLASTTVDSYKGQIEPYLIPELGNIKLKNLTTKKIEDHYQNMLDHGKRQGKGGLSKRTVEYQHTILRKALDKAIDWNRIEENPADKADPPKSQDKNKDIDPYELIEIIQSVDNEVWKDLFEFTLRTGLRRGEVLGLMWRAIDWDRKLLSIMRNLTIADGKPVLKDMTKNGTSYTLPIGEKTIDLLKKIKKRQEEYKKIYKNSFKDDGFVFTWEKGKYIAPNSYTKAFKRYAKKMGYEYNLHDLRHGFAAIQIISGTHTKTLQELLNHKSQSTTQDIYSHILSQQKTDATDIIDDFF